VFLFVSFVMLRWRARHVRDLGPGEGVCRFSGRPPCLPQR
jgi:hypothetical protein